MEGKKEEGRQFSNTQLAGGKKGGTLARKGKRIWTGGKQEESPIGRTVYLLWGGAPEISRSRKARRKRKRNEGQEK